MSIVVFPPTSCKAREAHACIFKLLKGQSAALVTFQEDHVFNRKKQSQERTECI